MPLKFEKAVPKVLQSQGFWVCQVAGDFETPTVGTSWGASPAKPCQACPDVYGGHWHSTTMRPGSLGLLSRTWMCALLLCRRDTKKSATLHANPKQQPDRREDSALKDVNNIHFRSCGHLPGLEDSQGKSTFLKALHAIPGSQ